MKLLGLAIMFKVSTRIVSLLVHPITKSTMLCRFVLIHVLFICIMSCTSRKI